VKLDPEKFTIMNGTFYKRFGKRALDLAGSALGLIIFCPVMLILAVLVKATSRGTILFRQTRVGQYERPFRIFKFRSMKGTASGPGALLTAAGDSRITPIGRFLRKTKLDELPQLINVLVGHMSLVGPRPEVHEYTAAYSTEQRRVLREKPGITGPAALTNFREEELLARQPDKQHFYLTYLLPAKLDIDLKYCAEVSFILDVKYILATVARLFISQTVSNSAYTVSKQKASVSAE
jgi:lipopolysaccharide/colanic/teichoic acid biosynthesis glycosyltransferase